MLTEQSQDPRPEEQKKKNSDYSAIGFLETPPRDEWFVERTNDQGNTLVYLRVCLTGMLPRIIGPFASREVAIWCLDGLLAKGWEGLEEPMTDFARIHSLTLPYHHLWNRIRVEDPVVMNVNGA